MPNSRSSPSLASAHIRITRGRLGETQDSVPPGQTFWTPRQVPRPRRVDDRLSSHSSTVERQLARLDDGPLTMVDVLSKESLNPLQGLASGEGSVIYISDAASDTSDASNDAPADETPPPIQAIMQSLKETQDEGSTVNDRDQRSNHEDEREPTYQAASFTPPDHEQTHQSTEPPFGEPTADCPTDVSLLAPLAPLIRASTLASLPAPLRTDYKLYFRVREASQGHDTEQSDAEELRGASSDVDYCPLAAHETEEDSEGQSSDEDLPSRKRRKRHSISRRNRSLSKGSASFTSAAGDKVAGSTPSALPERADNATVSTDAAFDEWVSQDVVLQRTIMNGKASFHFQFDWDLCMNHGEELGKICRTSSQQGRGRSTVKSNGRRKFTADEEQWLVTWKETQGLCWADIHQRFCDQFEERSKESLQVRYCTKLKRRDHS
ncbi:hypothetical protein G3M48_001449 [Beauveria asiatica]|uniref:Myb-like domain-containing protein n=1 Tax=Beauveria asiatica TaxID=1069075 RepID=A0AAW0RZW1_9HYPO